MANEWGDFVDYSRAGLEAANFQGFIALETLTRADVLGARGSADVEGVYVVLRPSRTRPNFIEDDHPNPRLPVMSTEAVADRWPEENPEILYIGKAPLRGEEGERRNGLANRLREFQRCGFSGGANHFGGRLVWRIADRDSLLICWKFLPEGTAADIESLMITEFRKSNVRHFPPFANIDAPKKFPSQGLFQLIAAMRC